MKLAANAIAKFLCGLLAVGCLLFLPAGTLRYPDAWRFIGLLFIPIFLAGLVLLLKMPGLLEKRLRGKEKQAAQSRVVALSGLMFLAAFVLAGLDFRFGWSHIPLWLKWAASALMLAGYGLYAEVMRENAWLSRTIEVQAGQQVVDTGLYGVVRHPMYLATLLLFLAMPLVLGSWVALLVMLPYPAMIILRIRNEEEVLLRELAGYAAYRQKVKYRLIPYIW